MNNYRPALALPPLVPKRGNANSHLFWQNALIAHGWQINGEIPNLPKALLIGAPHTSNMDGWYAFMAVMGLGLNITVMAKDSLFKPPFKKLLHWLNVLPVKRSSPEGLIEQIKQEFERHEAIWVGISPEGTRAGAEKWKSGFYRIAMRANVPIVMVAFDYKLKQIIFLGVFDPTGDYEQDLQQIQAKYYGITPHHPEKLSHPLRRKG
jgi:1-acyl-sn-glycerol-3-phosphate acyltransferase